MKFTKMNMTGQLDSQGAEKFASRIGISYIVVAIGAASAGVAALILAIVVFSLFSLVGISSGYCVGRRCPR